GHEPRAGAPDRGRGAGQAAQLARATQAPELSGVAPRPGQLSGQRYAFVRPRTGPAWSKPGVQSRPVSESRPNILLVAIDTLRADHLGCYGYARPTSPHLDRLAAEGVLFEDHYAPHIPTHPGFTTLFTGMDAFTHQRVRLGGDVLPDPKIKTLAQLLAEAGYRTAAVDNLPEWFRQGFELYRSYKWPWPMAPGQAWRRAELVNDLALPLLDELAAGTRESSRPFFLFLHYWEPHTPYLP